MKTTIVCVIAMLVAWIGMSTTKRLTDFDADLSRIQNDSIKRLGKEVAAKSTLLYEQSKDIVFHNISDLRDSRILPSTTIQCRTCIVEKPVPVLDTVWLYSTKTIVYSICTDRAAHVDSTVIIH